MKATHTRAALRAASEAVRLQEGRSLYPPALPGAPAPALGRQSSACTSRGRPQPQPWSRFYPERKDNDKRTRTPCTSALGLGDVLGSPVILRGPSQAQVLPTARIVQVEQRPPFLQADGKPGRVPRE